jgi:hypothetical protein
MPLYLHKTNHEFISTNWQVDTETYFDLIINSKKPNRSCKANRRSDIQETN